MLPVVKEQFKVRLNLDPAPTSPSMSRSSGFLNTLNPIARSRNNHLQNIHAFDQSSSLVEDPNNNGYDIPLQASDTLASPKGGTRPADMANLEAGVAQDEHDNSGGTDHASEPSDEEVPHSFMVETSPAARRKALLPQARSQRRVATGSRGARSDSQQKRASAGFLASGTGSLLPTTHPISTRIPHPDDIEEEDENDFDQDYAPLLGASKASNSASRRRKGKGKVKVTQDAADRRPDAVRTGLDEYQQALWRWVNVYNLDEYLQEVS